MILFFGTNIFKQKTKLVFEMDEWIEQNPRATLYILAISVLLIIVLTGFLWYYTKSQEYMKMVDRELLKQVKEKLTGKKKTKAKNISEVAEEASDAEADDGDNEFTIVDA